MVRAGVGVRVKLAVVLDERTLPWEGFILNSQDA